ncbi:MAG TPA: hypothetical protein VIJ19_07565 [Opitutaceae bacterium]
MNRQIACILFLACVSPALADDSFTKSLSPQDFAAAGLGKLTPAELAALDSLVHGSQAGAVAVAKDQTAKEVAQTVRIQVQAEDKKEAQKKESAGFFDRLKVTLRPGTEVQYTTLDAAILPPFDGFEKGTILTLDNGQRWAVVDDSSDYRNPAKKPVHVHIYPGSMGSFFMEIEGGGRPRVKFVSNVLTFQAPKAP